MKGIILAGGTGFYFRALTRGLFPGPGADPPLRARLDRIAERRGVTFLHRMLGRIDRESALRIQPRDRKRLVRALEVFFLTGRPLTAHFAETASPIADIDDRQRVLGAEAIGRELALVVVRRDRLLPLALTPRERTRG